MHFAHVALIASSKENAQRFYRDLLGFSLVRETYRVERESWKLDFKRDEMELEIFTFPESPKRPSYPEALGLRHLAFRVRDVEAWHEKLAEIQPEKIRVDDLTGKKFFFCSDYDHQPIEFYES